jgi:hypothetical protein
MSFEVQVKEAFDALVESFSTQERNLLSCVSAAEELTRKAFLEGYLQGVNAAASIYKDVELEPDDLFEESATQESLEIPCSEVAPGNAVIMNYFDRPTTRLVAIVDKIEDGICYATYLSDNTTIAHPRSPAEEVTPIADFRMRVVISDDRKSFSVERTSNEITAAYYKDGRLREWQGDSSDEELQPIRKAASIK